MSDEVTSRLVKSARGPDFDENGMTAADRHEVAIGLRKPGTSYHRPETLGPWRFDPFPTADLSRGAVIARIRQGLKRRSGKAWSVTGGRGTAYGWIAIAAPPARCTWRHRLKEGMPDYPEHYEEYDSGRAGGHMAPAEREELGRLLGLDGPVHSSESIPAGNDYRREYIDRAEGRPPAVHGTPYWD